MKKVDAKIPSWRGLDIPSSLNLEQCSSEVTALYKSGIVEGAGSLADLTGGLGVDSAAFSRKVGKVLYVERDQVLASAAERNFRVLGCTGIEVRCACTDSELLGKIPHQDWFYLDPARRSSSGRKLFLLEDCSPNVMELLPLLLAGADRVLLKLSPMVDITMLRHRFGSCLQEVHIVGCGGECKEVLCVLSSSFSGTEPLVVLFDAPESRFSFRPSDAENARVAYCGNVPSPDALLLEPDAVLMKAGCHSIVCRDGNCEKLSPSTHLFVCNGAGGDVPESFFKRYRVLEVLPFGRAGFRTAGARYPFADVSARGVPMRSEELAARIGVKPGGEVHIFGVTCAGDRFLVITMPEKG